MTDVGEQPSPQIEPADPPPGGVDAVEEQEYEVGAVVPELVTAVNPHVEVPEEVQQGEDTDDGPTSDGASEPEAEDQA